MFKGDNHEPAEILRFLGQRDVFTQEDLIHQGWSDYVYDGSWCFCHESATYNNERKTILDLLGNLDEVEAQLAHAIQRHPEVHNRLIIEGVWEPSVNGLLVYTRYQGKNMMSAGIVGQRQQTFKQITNWMRQVGKYWEIKQTSTMASTASLLSALYDSDQVDEDAHSTFKRLYKTNDYVSNPHASRLMGASGDVKIGPAKAEAVAHHFGTMWEAVTSGLFLIPKDGGAVSEWTKVPGIGDKLARDYLRSMGREIGL